MLPDFKQFDTLMQSLAPKLNAHYRSFKGIEEGEFRAAESPVGKAFNRVALPVFLSLGLGKSTAQVRRKYEREYLSSIIEFNYQGHMITIQGRNVGFGYEPDQQKPFQIAIRCPIQEKKPFILSLSHHEGVKRKSKTVFFKSALPLKLITPRGFNDRFAKIPDYANVITMPQTLSQWELLCNPDSLGRAFCDNSAVENLLKSDPVEVLTAGFGDFSGSGKTMVDATANVPCEEGAVLACVDLVKATLDLLSAEKLI